MSGIAPPPWSAPIRTKTYRQGTAEATAQAFTADATEAAQNGWFPSSQAWEGSTLTVTYQRQQAPSAPSTAAPASAGGLYVPAAAVGIGGALVALGSVLPWARAGLFTASGMEGDGLFTLAAGVGLILIGLAGAVDQQRASKLRALGALAALIAIVLAGYHIFNITSGVAQVGEGLYVVLVGGVIGLAGALKTRGEPPTPVVFDGARQAEEFVPETRRERGAFIAWVVIIGLALVAVLVGLSLWGQS